MDKLLYSKYSNQRNPKFNIRTDIIETGEGRVVRKFPMGKESEAHIAHIADIYSVLKDKFSGSRLHPNVVRRRENYIEFDYIQGKTLEAVLDDYLEAGDRERFNAQLQEYAKCIRTLYEQESFVPEEGFLRVFGKEESLLGLPAARNIDIDLIPSNIMIEKDGSWAVIDYEWTFDFLIPVDYLIWRACSVYLAESENRRVLSVFDLCSMLGISRERVAVFLRMEEHFSKEYCFKDTYMLQVLYCTMGEHKISLEEIKERTMQSETLYTLQFFYDQGEGYQEEKSLVLRVIPEKNGRIRAALEIPEGTTALRMDPAAESCIVELHEAVGITENEEYSLEWISNGKQLSDGVYAISSGDPQMYCQNWKSGTRRILLEYEISPYQAADPQVSSSRELNRAVENLEKHTRELAEKTREISKKEEKLREQEERIGEQNQLLQEQSDTLEHQREELERTKQEFAAAQSAKDAQIGSLSASLNESQRMLAEVMNSRSWRITSPMRNATNQLRKNERLRYLWRTAKAVKNHDILPPPIAAPNPAAVYPAGGMQKKGAGKSPVSEAKRKQMFREMKQKIDEAEVVSFDIFDTLLKRVVNTPEDVFELTGKMHGLENFRQKRQDDQMQASMRAERELQIPHADMNQIYEYIREQEPQTTDWEAVKQTEIQIEKDCLKQNREMYEIYRYAKQAGKRVIIVSDMYLLREDLEEALRANGYDDYDSIYISSEVHVTKFRGDIFLYVCEKEQIAPSKMVHIGDNYASDIANASAQGVETCFYQAMSHDPELCGSNPTLLTQGTLNCLYQNHTDFWYRLGALVGGPLYAPLAAWLEQKVQESGRKKVYFLARDGYNLHHIFKDQVPWEMEYLYASRRALLLAGIEKVDEDALEILPPFTQGQTIREVLDYLEVTEICGKDVTEAGFTSLEDVVQNLEDMQRVKKLYQLHEKEFLKKCAEERACAKKYFESIGFLKEDSIVFDCGWNGSSQYLMKRFLDCIGYEHKNEFFYVGIMDSNKSRKQLQNLPFSAFLFQLDVNRGMQALVKDCIVLFELFFGAPHESVYRYGEDGVILEQTGMQAAYKEKICQGIRDYVNLFRPFAKKYGIEISKQQSMAALRRLVENPTQEEAVEIGDIEDADGFATQKGLVKYIAKLTEESYEKNPQIEIYWPQGFFTRNDIPESLKERVARERGIAYGSNIGTTGALMNVRDLEYQQWIASNEVEEKRTSLRYRPFFSVVIPVYNVTDEQLIACIESVRVQTYRKWELLLVDDASTWPNVRETLKKYEIDRKIHIHYRQANGHISRATNDGIERSRGEFLVFMDCDDVIAPNALYEFAKKLNENRNLDFIYSDEDKLSEDGTKRHSPFFKPDWSPDAFGSLMYTNHLAVYRAALVKQIGGLRSEFNGVQDYDMTLRFMEVSDNRRVGHIPKVLYHWRERGESIASNPEAKPYALAALKRMKEEMLARRGLQGHIEYVDDMYQYRVVYDAPENTKVSIIIPSKDHPEMLMQCIDSIHFYTKAPNYEIIVVDNGSGEDNRREIEEYTKRHGILYHYEPMEFNFSRMCNIGAGLAKGNLLLFLNDDIQIYSGEWLSRLAGQASLSYAGAVGAKLYYPNTNQIQHDGILNLGIGPSHALLTRSDEGIYYFGRNRMEYNFLCVTGACLMIGKQKFEEVGGFDEKLGVAYNDVDLCFKFYEAGYYNSLRNDVTMYHHESVSRGLDELSEAKKKRLASEREYLYQKHPALKGKDPFYSQNLDPRKIDYSIRDNEAYKVQNEQTGSFEANPEMEETFTIVFDQISQDSRIVIKGWFFWENDGKSNGCTVEFVLKDEANHCICYDTNRIHRPDVAMALNNGAYRTGFECTIDPAELSLETTSYQIGLRLIPEGEETGKICMTEEKLPRVQVKQK